MKLKKAIEYLKSKEDQFRELAASGFLSDIDSRIERGIADTLCEVRFALKHADIHDSQASQEAYVQGRIREAGFLDAEAQDLLIRAYRMLNLEAWHRPWVDDYLDYQRRMQGVYGDKQNG